ncbi:MAG TPA: glutathione S-transferase family protein [Candidatus Binatia bacterium]|jgi:glutathione S-transferase|nr:glutathione S-transferase family protein [Candidatus Binatia bacterium]
MTEPYRIFGAEMSPYSVKVRSYFRYKGLPYRWIVRNADTEAEYRGHAKLPIVPLVVTPDGTVLQDSTPIIEYVEQRHPTPSIHPSEPTAAFVSALLEEFGDEWGNKWMFHLRWARDVDQLSAAGRIAGAMMPAADDELHAGMAAQVRARMVDRVWFVGSSPQTAPQIESTFRDALALLDTHLADRPYLFGGRPAFADFGLWGQIYEAWTDPTAGALIEGVAHHVLDWVHRMLWPRAEGEFERWDALAATLTPLLDRHVGRLFLPWSVANATALTGDGSEFTVALDGQAWTQKPQKYHAKSLRALREKYAAVADQRDLAALLERTGCLAALKP